MLRSYAHSVALACAALVVAFVAVPAHAAGAGQVSQPFSGAKVNGGTVTMARTANGVTLTLSSDFKVPDTPDPHWQVVDASGTTYLLQRLGIKGDRVNTTITVPSYIKSIAKVQIYCAWAEVVLGEAPFANPGTK